jgi:hypothetical protein
MRSFLVKQDLVVAIDGKAKKSTAMKDEEWDKIDEKAKATMFLSLSQNVLFNVHDESSTRKFGINFKVCMKWPQLQIKYLL